MGWWFYLCPVKHFERHLFMLQGIAALKLKGNLYFLCRLHTQFNKHIFGYKLNLFRSHKNWMEDCPVQHLHPVQHLCPVQRLT